MIRAVRRLRAVLQRLQRPLKVDYGNTVPCVHLCNSAEH